MEDIKKPKIKVTRKTKALATMGLITIVGAELIASVWAFNLWSKTHEFQSPLRSPIIKVAHANTIRPLAKTVSKQETELTKLEVIKGAGFAKPIKKIWILESNEGNANEGHHQSCNRINKTNDFGYFKGGNRNFCFDTFEESVQEVDKWLESELKTKTLAEALCYYNTGVATPTCPYYENYLSL